MRANTKFWITTSIAIVELFIIIILGILNYDAKTEINNINNTLQQVNADLILCKNTQTRDVIGEQVTVIADGSGGTIIGKSCVATEPGTTGCSNIVTVG